MATTPFDGPRALLTLKLDRAEAILGYSARYQIPADLATAIYDIALQEGIDPQLAFRLVKVESNFKPGAKSNMNAIGFTQVQLPTARFYDASLDEKALYERDVNLRIGFRFLNDLLKQYRHDYELALLAYNRGPGRVNQIVADGGDPSNGYENAVLGGTSRSGSRRRCRPRRRAVRRYDDAVQYDDLKWWTSEGRVLRGTSVRPSRPTAVPPPSSES